MQLIFWSNLPQTVFDLAKSSIFPDEFYRERPCRYRGFDRVRQLEYQLRDLNKIRCSSLN